MVSDFFFFFDMSTQGKEEGGFELLTLALLGVIYNRLNYFLGTKWLVINVINRDETRGTSRNHDFFKLQEKKIKQKKKLFKIFFAN